MFCHVAAFWLLLNSAFTRLFSRLLLNLTMTIDQSIVLSPDLCLEHGHMAAHMTGA